MHSFPELFAKPASFRVGDPHTRSNLSVSIQTLNFASLSDSALANTRHFIQRAQCNPKVCYRTPQSQENTVSATFSITPRWLPARWHILRVCYMRGASKVLLAMAWQRMPRMLGLYQGSLGMMEKNMETTIT